MYLYSLNHGGQYTYFYTSMVKSFLPVYKIFKFGFRLASGLTISVISIDVPPERQWMVTLFLLSDNMLPSSLE